VRADARQGTGCRELLRSSRSQPQREFAKANVIPCRVLNSTEGFDEPGSVQRVWTVLAILPVLDGLGSDIEQPGKVDCLKSPDTPDQLQLLTAELVPSIVSLGFRLVPVAAIRAAARTRAVPFIARRHHAPPRANQIATREACRRLQHDRPSKSKGQGACAAQL